MFIYQCENMKQKTQWIVHAERTEIQVAQYVLNNIRFNAHAICTYSVLWFLLPRPMKLESKRI
jgi:hypothetical protein